MDGCAAGMLDAAERFVVERTAVGEPAVFPHASAAKPRIRATVIRHLLLGEAVPGARETASVQWPGVRIHGATIEGLLDLADCARPGAGLPTLALENCDIRGSINLATARLARLSLAHSRFTLANLREAEIDGPFDFSYAHGFDSGDCWIDARGAMFGGELIGNQAKLRAPSKRRVVATGDRHSALWLAGATIRGSIRLTSHFEAIGGVSLDGATIHGDVVLANAVVVSGEDDAFRAENANVDGVMRLHHFLAEGVVWLHGLRTGGVLEISDARIYGDHPIGHGSRHAPRGEPLAVIISDAEIGASMRLSPNLVADGVASFQVSKIRGHVDARGARLINRSDDGRARAVHATYAEIGASLMFDDATVAGRLDIAGARIGGHLSLLRASLANQTQDSTGKALEAMNVTVGGNVEFGRHGQHARTTGSTGQPSGARVAGAIDLTGAHIGGELAFSGSVVDNPVPPPPNDNVQRFLPNDLGLAIVARQTHVSASVLLNANFAAFGALIFTGASIGRDLLCQHAELHNPGRSALYAKDIEIGDDLKLWESSAWGDLRFERAAVTGSVNWRNLTLSRDADPHALVASPSPAPSGPPSTSLPHRHVSRWRHTIRSARWLRAVRSAGACMMASLAWCRDLVTRLWRQPAKRASHVERPADHARLELAHARIGASLKCEGVHFQGPARIDLSGMRVTTLDLSHSQAWGRPVWQDIPCPIALDGLTYGRIVFPDDRTRNETPATNPREEVDVRLRKAVGIPVGCWRWAAPHGDTLADRLLDWVLRDADNADLPPLRSGGQTSPQHADRATDKTGGAVGEAPAKAQLRRFNPQPYRQLARILRIQGYEAQARYIAIAEQWATPRYWFRRLVYGAYGIFFGFGLRPRRAVVTLLAYVTIGTGFAMVAQYCRLMVETPLIAASAFTSTPGADDGLARRAFVLANGLQTTTTELACIDITASPFDGFVYAMDTVLPFIPLHQETKCELAPRHHMLRFFRACYAVLGWVVTSLALLTISGILKRSDGEQG